LRLFVLLKECLVEIQIYVIQIRTFLLNCKLFGGYICSVLVISISVLRLKINDHGFIRGYGNLKILVIHINLSKFIICKNFPSIINTITNIRFILYFCKTIFKDYYSIIIIH